METKNTAHSQRIVTAQNGGAVTFDQIYASYWKPLYRTAFRILKDEQAAEDVIQDTFVRLWESWDTILDTNIKGWLFTTSYRLVLKSLKRVQATEKIGNISFSEPLAREADETIRAKQLQLQVNTCVDNLPDQCRKVYNMSRQDEFSIKRIALELGIAPKTVEYHISMALRRIRQGIGSVTCLLLFFSL